MRGFWFQVKSLKRPAARVFGLRPTKLLVVRMKKPLVPRVKSTLRASSFTRLIAGHFKQLLSEENPDFYLPSLKVKHTGNCHKTYISGIVLLN